MTTVGVPTALRLWVLRWCHEDALASFQRLMDREFNSYTYIQNSTFYALTKEGQQIYLQINVYNGWSLERVMCSFQTSEDENLNPLTLDRKRDLSYLTNLPGAQAFQPSDWRLHWGDSCCTSNWFWEQTKWISRCKLN